MDIKKLLRWLLFASLSIAIGSIGTIATSPAIPGWYASLVKPPLNPPNWIFAPVWTLLFAFMGTAAFLVYEKGIDIMEVKGALKLFAIQFGLNVLWSFLFFGLQSPFVAFVGIAVLWIYILKTIRAFYPIEKFAAYLLVPYIAWVSFASYLNLAIAILNK